MFDIPTSLSEEFIFIPVNMFDDDEEFKSEHVLGGVNLKNSQLTLFLQTASQAFASELVTVPTIVAFA